MAPTRILCVADAFPWPARDGYRLRLANVAKALAEVGPTDFYFVPRGEADASAAPPELSSARMKVTPAPGLPVSPALLARTVASPLPRRLLWRDWEAARDDFRDWTASTRYDLVWYSHADAYAGLGPASNAGATVIDLDNLEDRRLLSLREAHVAGLRRALRRPSLSPRFRGEVRSRVSGIAATADAARWRRLHDRYAASVDRVVVCSDLDRGRLGSRNAVVVPNGYDEQPGEVGDPNDGHVMTMVGLFHYGPNSDGASFFAEEVLPRVRAQVGDAEARFVGRHDGHLGDLDRADGVVLTGEVPDVSAELASSRVAIVPLRAGSGTRLKVLEAFACGVPVVSTTIGCEGLDVEPGRHLLIADDPEGFAAACTRLLTDDGLWSQIAREASALFRSRYRWDDIRPLIADLVTSAVPGRPVADPAGL